MHQLLVLFAVFVDSIVLDYMENFGFVKEKNTGFVRIELAYCKGRFREKCIPGKDTLFLPIFAV